MLQTIRCRDQAGPIAIPAFSGRVPVTRSRNLNLTVIPITRKAAPSARRYYRNDLASALIYSGLVALIFAQYLTTAIPAYLALMMGLLLRRGTKLPSRIVLYLCAVVLYWLAVLNFAAGKNIVTHILFYFGFLIPLIVFASDKRISTAFFVNEKAIIGLCMLILFEAVLFNSPLGPHLYFFPPDGSNERVAMFGFYQRPLGIAGTAPLTAVVLYFLVVLYEQMHGAIKFSTQALVFVTTLALASGTGFGFLLVYLIVLVFRSRRLSVRHLALGFVYLSILAAALALAFGYVVDLGDLRLSQNFDKFSIGYFVLMYDYKMYVLESFMQGANWETILFGMQTISSVAATTGDTGVLTAANATGVMGAALLFAAPLLYLRAIRRNLVPTLFFGLSFIHYIGLLTPPGQLLLAGYIWLLVRTERETKEMRSPAPKDIVLSG